MTRWEGTWFDNNRHDRTPWRDRWIRNRFVQWKPCLCSNLLAICSHFFGLVSTLFANVNTRTCTHTHTRTHTLTRTHTRYGTVHCSQCQRECLDSRLLYNKICFVVFVKFDFSHTSIQINLQKPQPYILRTTTWRLVFVHKHTRIILFFCSTSEPPYQHSHLTTAI